MLEQQVGITILTMFVCTLKMKTLYMPCFFGDIILSLILSKPNFLKTNQTMQNLQTSNWKNKIMWEYIC